MSSGQEVGDIFGEGSGPATSLLRSPTVLIASIGLFGMNVYFFHVIKIDYIRVLNLDLEKEKAKKSEFTSGEDSTDLELMTTSLLGTSTIPTTTTKNTTTTTATVNATITSNGVSSGGEQVTASMLIGLSVGLMALLHLSSFIWITMLGGTPLGAIFFFYAIVLCGIGIPFPQTSWIRRSSLYVIKRIAELLNPRCACISYQKKERPIPFMDVFVADGMCSLSKVFFDWGMLWHLASHYPERVPASTHAIVIPSLFASWPYIVRARQCLIMYSIGCKKKDPSRHHHMLNAIKYSTSLFPLIVSAYQKSIQQEYPQYAAFLDTLLILLLIINSVYSLAWDIIMDWGMMKNPKAVMEYSASQCIGAGINNKGADMTCGQAFLRPKLRFGVLASLIILFTDSLLRFSWTLRFVSFGTSDFHILLTQFLEVFRRGIWNLLRVEWEHIKQTMNCLSKKKKGLKDSFDENEVYPPDNQTASLIRTNSSSGSGSGISLSSN